MANKDKNIFKRIKSSSWAKGLLTTFIGSLLSISLTFGVNSCRDTFQQKADRHLAALMVLGNIEMFARNLETWQKENQPFDSACAIVLALPEDAINTLSDDSLDYYVTILKSPNPTIVSHDETAAKIFSNNIETWKNVGNAMFIQKVGQLFSVITTAKQILDNIGKQISDYYQESMTSRLGSIRDGNIAFLKSRGLRQLMLNAHYAYNGYPNYTKAYLRYWNKKCMDLIGVTEEEVNQHLAGLEEQKRDEDNEPKIEDFM